MCTFFSPQAAHSHLCGCRFGRQPTAICAVAGLAGGPQLFVRLQVWQTAHSYLCGRGFGRRPTAIFVRLRVWQTASAKPATSQKNPCEERSDEATEKQAHRVSKDSFFPRTDTIDYQRRSCTSCQRKHSTM